MEFELSIQLNAGQGKPDPAADPTTGSEPDNELWRGIRDLVLDVEGATMPFSARLARDHLWSQDYAEAVVREYRRFLYLAATEPSMVTPSEDVDEAWHLHLAYTRSYWDDLCGRVLQRPLHHDPTGGQEDEAGFRAAYDHTLWRYHEVFAMAPPLDVWPPVAARFALAEGFRTVPLRDFHLAGRMWGSAMDALVTLVFVMLAGVMWLATWSAGLESGGQALFVGLWAVPAWFVLARLNRTMVLPRWGAGGLGFAKYRTPPADSGSGGCGGCGGCGG